MFIFKEWYKKGYFAKNVRTNIALYYFFKLFFGLNKKAKFIVNFTSTAICPEKIQLGKNVEKSFIVSGGCYFQAINGIIIGDNTIFSSGVKLISANHDLENNSHSFSKPIRIGENCWLGVNVVILPGVELGPHTIVGAGSVVTKSFPKGNITIKGVPAK
jgi:acetyltransferase-like isoleucine patch superfamily enzyme